ncbi:MAG TPA: DNA polymerase III subunit epsilon [Dokdonella sp.]|uniref:DNA polymerase III subunit epsilon n=1 Tax=Dokdonella sp. TaxID=2291710 RepID=UPI002D7F5D40|nr:DNA polymerase III subunit epsilon [Dokdonella sp.]HET9032382.1 DNA polymerase III subunit epsilon [Dokdonella sp.]
MRQIVLDTETTGLEVKKGHRVIEIGCVELLERRPSGRTWHRYLNPDRAVDEGARAVHGIDDAFLLDKPRFADIVVEFIAFVGEAEIIAHNASFDVGFLDAELALVDPSLGGLADHARILDTLALAREKFPGQQNNLNALCRRLGVDNRHRELHGALVDAHLLADVYLAMTAGQGDLGLALEAESGGANTTVQPVSGAGLRILRASAAEAELHSRKMASIDAASAGRAIWNRT